MARIVLRLILLLKISYKLKTQLSKHRGTLLATKAPIRCQKSRNSSKGSPHRSGQKALASSTPPIRGQGSLLVQKGTVIRYRATRRASTTSRSFRLETVITLAPFSTCFSSSASAISSHLTCNNVRYLHLSLSARTTQSRKSLLSTTPLCLECHHICSK